VLNCELTTLGCCATMADALRIMARMKCFTAEFLLTIWR
jgi:hypothetical protein